MWSIKKLGVKEVHRDIRSYVDELKAIGAYHIHYGYWDKATKSFPEAQDKLYQSLKGFIPAHVKSILDIGGGIGGTSFLLARDGYKPVCIVPDRLLVEEGRKRFANINFLKSSAESFRISAKSDLALLLESYQYFTYHYRALSNIINHLIKNGYIMIVDEFSTVRRGPLNEADLVRFLAKKRYFIEHRQDITDNIFPTCEYLEHYFKNKNCVFSLKWQDNKKEYLSSRTRYLVLLFKSREGKDNSKRPHG